MDALEAALFGDISQVTLLSTGIAAVVCVVAVILTKVIYDKLVLAMISEDLAISKGINVAKTNLLYLFLVSVVVAIGIQIVGTLLVGFLVIVPAIAAKNLSGHMKRYSLLSAVFGAIAGFSGVLVWSAFSGSSNSIPFPGPMVVFVRHHHLCSNHNYKLETENNNIGEYNEKVYRQNLNRHNSLSRRQDFAYKTQYPPLRGLLGFAWRQNGPWRNHRANDCSGS